MTETIADVRQTGVCCMERPAGDHDRRRATRHAVRARQSVEARRTTRA